MNPQNPRKPLEKSANGRIAEWALLGLHPLLLAVGVFVAGGFEERGSKTAGGLWVPFAILVTAAFGSIYYVLFSGEGGKRCSLAGFTRSMFTYLLKQLGVLIVLALLGVLAGQLMGFGTGRNR